jgi:hypothetical protein
VTGDGGLVPPEGLSERAETAGNRFLLEAGQRIVDRSLMALEDRKPKKPPQKGRRLWRRNPRFHLSEEDRQQRGHLRIGGQTE